MQTSPQPKQQTSIMGQISDGWKIMHDTSHDVMVDLIMVQVISLFIGSFLLLATKGNELNGDKLTWIVALVMVFFVLAGAVYRRLSR